MIKTIIKQFPKTDLVEFPMPEEKLRKSYYTKEFSHVKCIVS